MALLVQQWAHAEGVVGRLPADVAIAIEKARVWQLEQIDRAAEVHSELRRRLEPAVRRDGVSVGGVAYHARRETPLKTRNGW